MPRVQTMPRGWSRARSQALDPTLLEDRPRRRTPPRRRRRFPRPPSRRRQAPQRGGRRRLPARSRRLAPGCLGRASPRLAQDDDPERHDPGEHASEHRRPPRSVGCSEHGSRPEPEQRDRRNGEQHRDPACVANPVGLVLERVQEAVGRQRDVVSAGSLRGAPASAREDRAWARRTWLLTSYRLTSIVAAPGRLLHPRRRGTCCRFPADRETDEEGVNGIYVPFMMQMTVSSHRDHTASPQRRRAQSPADRHRGARRARRERRRRQGRRDRPSLRARGRQRSTGTSPTRRR